MICMHQDRTTGQQTTERGIKERLRVVRVHYVVSTFAKEPAHAKSREIVGLSTRAIEHMHRITVSPQCVGKLPASIQAEHGHFEPRRIDRSTQRLNDARQPPDAEVMRHL